MARTNAPNTNRNAKRFGHCIMGSSVKQPYLTGAPQAAEGGNDLSPSDARAMGPWSSCDSLGQRVHEIHRPDELAGGRHRSEPLLEDRRDVARAIQARQRARYREADKRLTPHE